jgi:putative nicotinate phosphoribosyltransferase
MQWLSRWKITRRDIDDLAAERIPGTDKPLHRQEYLNYLGNPRHQRLRIKIKARLEGGLGFPHEPLGVLTGPKWQLDVIEAAALGLFTHHTRWATIASQFWLAAHRVTGGRAKLYEFGLRRTPEWGGLGGSRSAYIAGWDGTSNRYASRVYGIPNVGTLPHSFIMAEPTEMAANLKWLRHMPPDIAAALPDTYATTEGMDIHFEACKMAGVEPRLMRIDSGDFEYLSAVAKKKAAKLGFERLTCIASNSLDAASVFKAIRVDNAPVDAFGVGGNFVNQTQDKGEAAVMKLARVTGRYGAETKHAARDTMKFSKGKASYPGVQEPVHMYEEVEGEPDRFRGSVIIEEGMEIGVGGRLGHEIVSMPRGDDAVEGAYPFAAGTKYILPNVIVMEDGKPTREEFRDEDSRRITNEARTRFFGAMESLDLAHKDFLSPRLIGFGAESGLHERQQRMILENRLNQRRRAQGQEGAQSD